MDHEPLIPAVPLGDDRAGLDGNRDEALIDRLDRDRDRVVSSFGVGNGLLGSSYAFLVAPWSSFPGNQDI